MYNSKPLKILFIVRRIELFRCRPILLELTRRGHEVLFLFDKRWTPEKQVERFTEIAKKEMPLLKYRTAVSRHDRWRVFLFFFRELRAYRRYALLENQSPFYLKRWAGYLPRRLRILVEHEPVRSLLRTRIAGALFASVERSVPANKKIVQDIATFAPDVVFAFPTNLRFSSADLEYLKAAKQMRIPSAVLALTWDNLTTKGLLHIIPDRLFAWNKLQKREAESQHDVSSDCIVITGSPTFDALFADLKPSCTREEYCKKYGIASEDPLVLYLGTSHNLTPDERDLILSLRKAFDESSDDQMRRIQIVMRPHPANSTIYQGFEQRGITLVPKYGETPDTSDELNLFYDSLFYAVTAVGVNTSAMIDSIILGKSVVAFLSPQYTETQSQTQHFQQLLGYDVVERAVTPEECVERVRDLYHGSDMRKEKRNRFINDFIRPRGRDQKVSEIIVQELEKLAR